MRFRGTREGWLLPSTCMDEWVIKEQAAKMQRLFDLARFMRGELLRDGLVTNEEYAELAKEHASVARLETYDGMRKQIDEQAARIAGLEMALNEAKILRDGFKTACDLKLDEIDGLKIKVAELDRDKARLVEALKAMVCVMDRGPQPKKLDEALSWRECDEKARELADAAIDAAMSGVKPKLL